MKVKSVFITKNLAEIASFQHFCNLQKLQLTAHSFISFQRVAAVFRLPAQVYFFSSKNGVDFFLEQQVIEPSKKIACIGSATKKHLEQLGYQVAFCGEEAGNPTEVGIQLKSWLEDRRIAFICSDLSRKTVSAQIPEHQKEETVFYRTQILGKRLNEQFDAYVFTSPSNVTGFLMQNQLRANSTIIAWGKTTAQVLVDNGVKPAHILNEASFEELESILLT